MVSNDSTALNPPSSLWGRNFAHEGAGAERGASLAPGHTALLAFLDHPTLSTPHPHPPQPPCGAPVLCVVLLIFAFSEAQLKYSILQEASS